MNFTRKSLNDLVKGIRNHKKNPEPFIKNALNEIKNELNNQNMEVKAVAIQKLTYLSLMGHSMEWAAFQITELMGQQAFHLKRIGYLAAQFALEEDMDEMVLIEQLLRKDLSNSKSPYYTGQAMNCLANIMTPGLAENLSREISLQMSAHSPYVRKRAVSLTYKVFLKYPEALRPTFPKLKEKLKDNHPSVVACAVNVVCELANKNPRNYLPLAPLFYKLLTTVHSNWTLIKIVKLMGTLTPYEPRLAKKLSEPMINIINTTQAKSLLYECCYTVTKGMYKQMAVVRLAVEKLKTFVADEDQNLKYLGLLGLSNLMNRYPRIIADLKKEILDCLHDEDITIRYRAVDLLTGVVTKKNIKGITKKLINAMEDSEEDNFRQFLVERLVTACCRNNYENVANFRWMLGTLARLSELRGLSHAELLASKMMDILIRVKSSRTYGVSIMLQLLNAPHMQEYNQVTDNSELLKSAAWLIGEFIDHSDEEPLDILDVLLGPSLSNLPPKIQATFIQAIMKVYAAVSAQGKPKEVNLMDLMDGNEAPEEPEEDGEEPELTAEEYQKRMADMRQRIRTGFEQFLKSSNVEVQERASICLSLLQMHEDSIASGNNIADELEALFEEELNPVGPSAQEKVPIPPGLDLNQWIGDPFDSSLDNLDQLLDEPYENQDSDDHDVLSDGDFISLDEENSGKKTTYEDSRAVFVLPSGGKKQDSNTDDIKVVDMRTKKRGDRSGKKKRRRRRRRPIEIEENVVISTTEEMPEGYDQSKERKKKVKVEEPKATDRLSQIDLTQPIREDEQLPEIQSYPIKTEAKKKEEEKPRRRRRPKDGDEEGGRRRRRRRPKDGEEEGGKRRRRRRPKDGEEEGGKRRRRRRRPKPDGDKKAQKVGDFFEQPEEEKPQEPVKPKERASKRKMATDDNIRVTWNSKVKPNSSTSVSIPILFENLTDSPLSNVSLKLEGANDNVSAQAVEAFNIGPKKKSIHNVIFKIKDFVNKMALSGIVSYGDDEKKTSLDFDMALPSCMWLSPSVIQLEDFANLMKTQQLPHRGSNKMPLVHYATIDALAKEVCRQMRFSVVQREDGKAYNLYARSFSSHHVALQLKLVKNQINVDMKSSNETLTNNLMQFLVKNF